MNTAILRWCIYGRSSRLTASRHPLISLKNLKKRKRKSRKAMANLILAAPRAGMASRRMVLAARAKPVAMVLQVALARVVVAAVTQVAQVAQGTQEDQVAQVAQEDQVAQGTQEDQVAQGTQEDQVAQGTQEDQVAQGTQEDQVAQETREVQVELAARVASAAVRGTTITDPNGNVHEIPGTGGRP
jgi:hypothetical protein